MIKTLPEKSQIYLARVRIRESRKEQEQDNVNVNVNVNGGFDYTAPVGRGEEEDICRGGID